MKIFLFITIFLIFTGKTQLDVNPEEGTKSNEPHYVDGRHNPEFLFKFSRKKSFFYRHEHSEQELKEHKEIFNTYDLNKVVFFFFFFKNGIKLKKIKKI